MDKVGTRFIVYDHLNNTRSPSVRFMVSKTTVLRRAIFQTVFYCHEKDFFLFRKKITRTWKVLNLQTVWESVNGIKITRVLVGRRAQATLSAKIIVLDQTIRKHIKLIGDKNVWATNKLEMKFSSKSFGTPRVKFVESKSGVRDRV